MQHADAHDCDAQHGGPEHGNAEHADAHDCDAQHGGPEHGHTKVGHSRWTIVNSK